MLFEVETPVKSVSPTRGTSTTSRFSQTSTRASSSRTRSSSPRSWSESKTSGLSAAQLQQSINERNDIIAEKDEIIAKLKLKLEAARSEATREMKFCDGQSLDERLAVGVEYALQKSEELLESMCALDSGEEVKQQWSAMMTSHENHKDRLAKIEALVVKRSEQLQTGDPEFKLCRQVRGLCMGAQKQTRK